MTKTQCRHQLLLPTVTNPLFKITNKCLDQRKLCPSDVCPDLTRSENSLDDSEINIESIRALEEEIRDRESPITNLRRTRIPQLDASTLSPGSM